MIALIVCMAAPVLRAAEEQNIRRASGIAGGLAVLLCPESPDKLPAALCEDEHFLVHVLDTDAARVAAVRKQIVAKGLYGKVSAEVFDGKALPHVDNLVNLVVAEKPGAVPEAEVMRVLAPNGVAMIGGRKTVKPRPADIDEWTHYLHDPSGNAVAHDQRVGPVRRVQWMAGPQHTRDHDALASMSAMTTSGGRVFYILDEGHTSLMHRPAKWRLVARDAFNGVLLWKRTIPTWVTHLWYFRSGPAQLTRRLVSVGDRVYVTLGLDAPVSVLDGATGKTIRTLDDSGGTEEILCHKGTLLTVQGDPDRLNDEAPKVFGYWELSTRRKPVVRKTITAFDAETGTVRWRKKSENLAYLVPLSLTALGEKVLFLDNEKLHCVALADGKELWQAPFPTEGLFLRNYTPTIVAHDDVVLCLTWDRLHAFSLADGKRMWTQKGSMGFASAADLFVVDGLAWTIPLTSSIWRGNKVNQAGKIVTGVNIPRENFLGKGGQEIWGIDIHTGEVKQSFPRSKVLPGGHHHRCYRNKATDKYLICGRRGLEFVDLEGKHHVNNWWVRGLCQYGVMPANGYVYVPPDPCQCFNVIKVNGFCVLSAGNSLDKLKPAGEALERGKAYATVQNRAPAAHLDAEGPTRTKLSWQPPIWPKQAGEWPTYRGNVTRSGSTPADLPTKLKVQWQCQVGSPLTASVAAGGRVYVCTPEAHTVHCLDAETGKEVWRFQAGGRVDSPPTLLDRLCLFGCQDGRVYCLHADDGALVWRYRIGPVDRRIVQDSRLASVWPTFGSVLVLDNVVYAAAGRSSYLDGGIRLVALNAYTGEKLAETTHDAQPGPLGLRGPRMDGALAGVLVSDGSSVTMRHLQFARDLKTASRGRPKTLITSTGLLEDAWAHRQPWRLGTGRGGVCSQSKLIVFDADMAYGVMNPYTWLKKTRSMWPAGHDGHLHQKYSRYKTSQFPIGVKIASAPNGAGGGKRRRPGKAAPAKAKGRAGTWTLEQAIQPRAMVLAGKTLLVAGWRDAVVVHEKTGRPLDPANPDPRATFLRAVSAANGKTLAEYDLPAEVVYDGMCVAYGKLYVPLRNGQVHCFAPSE